MGRPQMGRPQMGRPQMGRPQMGRPRRMLHRRHIGCEMLGNELSETGCHNEDKETRLMDSMCTYTITTFQNDFYHRVGQGLRA
jgi:hypothetical protein